MNKSKNFHGKRRQKKHLGFWRMLQMDKVTRRIKTILLEITNGFLIWIVGFTPSHYLRRFFYRLAGMKIGKGSTIHMAASIYNAGGIFIGEDSIIGEWAVLD